ncbi:MAG: S1 RNA-binding domain-containing protein [Planctomycetes bacterium]|nr:S1 RNA-binding domain-containing protein [Planctomycetota bacterium]
MSSEDHSEDRIDEQAIRAQLERALEAMDADAAGPNEEEAAPEEGPQGGSGDPHLHGGTILSVQGKDVFVELGPRSQGVISSDEFEQPPAPGERYEFTLVSIQDGLWTLSRKEARVLATWKELARGKSVKATVIGENSGGLELKVGPVSAFMPASEIALSRVADFAPFVGQTMICEVMEVSRRRRRVVLSRRAVLQRERREQRERTLLTLAAGQVVRGRVEKIEPFGAFVDIGGGVTGLLHVSNISHKRVADPASVLCVGQEIEVQVLEVKEGGKRIGLGMKQLEADPWDTARERIRAGQVVRGRVARLAEFGAFVELEGAIEGLLHRSQLAPERVNRVEDAVKVGDEITVRVQAIDAENRRISLSRLGERGGLLGSDEDVGNADVGRYLESGSAPTTGTNLGALLREALERREKKPR